MNGQRRQITWILIISLILTMNLICMEKTRAAEDKPSVTTDMTVSSKYVWRGLLVTDDPVLQPSLTVDYRNLTLNVWANHDLTDRGPSGASEVTEVDYTVEYAYSVDALSFSWGVIQYTFPNTGSEGTTEFYGSVAYDIVLSPTLSVYYDTDEAGGVYGNVALTHSLPIPELAGVSPSLDLSGSIGFASSNWNEFYYGVDDSSFVDLLITATLSVPIDEHLSINPFVSYSHLVDSGLEDAVKAAGSNDNPLFAGAVLSIAF